MQSFENNIGDSFSSLKKNKTGYNGKRPQFKPKAAKIQYQPRKTQYTMFDAPGSPPNKHSSAVVLSSEGSDKKPGF